MDNMIEMNVEQKLCKIMLMLRQIRPYYSAVYEVMEKRETTDVPTIGVDLTSVAYNPEFVQDINMAELLFVMLHEIGHIALMHVARRENRDPELWNIACDYYVNAVLSDEFNLSKNKISYTIGRNEIQLPDGILLSDCIDINKDAVENIYETLNEQANKNGYNTRSSNNQSNSYKFEIKGSNGTGEEFEIDKNFESDLISGGEDQLQKDATAKKIIADAVTRVEMSTESSNGGIGSDAGSLMRKSKAMLKSKLDWKKLLKKYLIIHTSKDSSFARPDKRMSYQKSIYPGQMALDEYRLQGVKVCIDTSGSISKKDLMYFCGQVFDISKTFKMQAEVVYWDSIVQVSDTFLDYASFNKIDCMGGGGTNPKCIFEYFESKKCKVKPVVSLIFTDGYFNIEEIDLPKYRKKYRETIWVMTKDHCEDFKPPFGKVAYAKFL